MFITQQKSANHRGRVLHLLLITTLFLLGLLSGSQLFQARLTQAIAAAAPPVGFQNQLWIVGLNEPTSIVFTPDGRMLIAERDGTIHVAQPGATQVDPLPFHQISNINTDQGERGLVGLVLDPDFANNNYYYVFYTANTPIRDRVARFTASGNSTLPGSEFQLWQDNVDAGLWHHGGALAFGPDGKLYIATGDHYDTGSGSANVAQRLDSFRGKMLRLNPDGSIPTDNPFYDGAGPNLDAIWARGLRNPFRFTFNPFDGEMIISDNGDNHGAALEEVNRGIAGANYGWPLCGGTCGITGMTNPIFEYSHNGRDASIIGGPVYNGAQFPASYQGVYFYADYVQNWIRYLTFDGNGDVTGSHYFEPPDATEDGPYGEIVDLKVGPDGSLYYVDFGVPFVGTPQPGAIRRISYTSANQPPTITTASANPTSGPGPNLLVNFTGAAADPEGDPLTYTWNFGDGQTANTANASHTYVGRGRYTARLIVSDGPNQTISDPIVITVGNVPVANITTPTNGLLFRAGQEITFSGTATDPDEPPTPAMFTWTVVLHHESHIHPAAGPFGGVTSGSFTTPTDGHDFFSNNFYEIALTVTDADGLQGTDSVFIYPERVNLTFNTSPAGLLLNFDQYANVNTPFSYNTLINFQHVIEAPLTQMQGESLYEFVCWSDGGAAAHTLSVPSQNQTYTAHYQSIPTPTPTATPLPGSAHALTFDGLDDLVRANAVANVGPLTVETWIRPATSNSTGLLVVTADTNAGWSLELNNGLLTFWLYTNLGWQSSQHPTLLTAGQWAHVAATYQGGTAQTFVNGVPSAAAPVGTLTQGSLLNFGGLAGFAYYQGDLDDVRLSNNARYTVTFTPPARPLALDGNSIGLWRFNEGTGQTANDLSAAANHATLGTSTAPDPADPVWLGISGEVAPPRLPITGLIAPCNPTLYLPVLQRP
jgi:glucose/arabinose dehydrogenase